MKAAPISDLKNRLSFYLRLVRGGETVTVLDRGHAVAQITPIDSGSDELDRLAAAGIVRLPIRPVSKDFWTRKLPRAAVSVVAAIKEDRDDRL
jgi:antitoxin (DNA-binding transcriptional repressor) of toxin-antitoxin stability system